MAKLEKAANDLDFYKNRDDTHPQNLNYEPPVEDFYGPVATELRYCTDVICIIVWIIFLGFSFAYGFYAYQEFKLERLFRSSDFRTDLCGIKQLENKPYAYFLDPDNLFDIAICVEKCPNTLDYTEKICLYDIDGQTILEDYCYDTYYTDPYLVYCMPMELGQRRNAIEKIINTDIEIFKRIAGDFWINIELIIGAFAVQIVVGVIFVIILLGKRIAHMMVWAFVTGFCVTMVFLSKYLDEEKGNTIQRDCPIDIQDPYQCVAAHLYLLEITKQTLLYLIPVYVFFLIFCFHQILRMIQLMESMLKPLKQMLHVLLIPFFISLLQTALAILFILVLIGGVNSGRTETVPAPNGFSSTDYRKVQFQIWQERGFYVVLFFMLWTLQTLYYYVRCFIACSCSVWYFTRDKNYLNAPMLRPLWYTIRYHLGSFLMGALLVPILWIPSSLFYYWKNILLSMPRKSFLLHILLFFSIPGFWFYEYLGKYISHRNFMHIATFGESFWMAGQKVFYLRERNSSRVEMMRKSLGFVRLIGMLFISSVGTYLVYYSLYSDQIVDRYVIDVKQAVHFPIVPAIYVFLVGLYISQNFSSIIDIIAEVTIFDLVAEEEMFMGQQRFGDQDMLDIVNKYSKEKQKSDFVVTNQGKINPMNEGANANEPLSKFDLGNLMEQDEEEPEEPEIPEPPIEEPKESVKSDHDDEDEFGKGNALDLDELGDMNNKNNDEQFDDELAEFNRQRVQDANNKKKLEEDVINLDKNKQQADGAKKTDRKRF
ncbi:unnamed protein product [Paramecium sonneborni]|uniref:Choline transporter-like protein n=1 Tax=Paramecium sonneborni TaxID=65129 RepID=A0A8S1L3U4_9CILI|nr:unnamed protein product [Paramecium sonneborni]